MSDIPYSLPDAGRNDLRYADYRGTTPLRVVVLGGCMGQLAADALRRIGEHSGFGVEASASWPTSLAALDQAAPDVVVLQLSTTWLQGPLWDRGAFYDDSARREMVEFIKESCALTIAEVRGRARSALLLVHGFSRPMVSPLGLHDFRHEYHFDRVIFEINEHLRGLLRHDLNAMYLDEERVFANAGKRRLLDHLVAPFSHHGPIDMAAGPPLRPSREETFGITHAVESAYVLAREYLDHFVAWKGEGRIKCVIVDLDETLWPLTVAEDGFRLDDPGLNQALVYGTWAGIHQALALLKRRGVLLAVASRNSHDVVMAEWQRLQAWAAGGEVEHLLGPEDFVLHEINWGPKSESVARILAALGITDADALFIDDSPVERAEVSARHPGITVLGDNLNLVRGFLLTNPRLQSHKVSSEAESRTTLVKAQLQREATRRTAPSRREFFESLNIEVRVRRLRPGDDLHRCVELLQRTNQFNTTLRRRSAEELQAILHDAGSALMTLEVSDRFGAYGTVGLCILQGEEVTDFVMSCRVIGLSPELPFLRAALGAHGRSRYRASLVEGPRNQPCRSLFRDAGFRPAGEGRWELASLADLSPVDPALYRTVLLGETAARPGL